MATKYNERYIEISKKYNCSLEEGRYEDTISYLDEMIFIANEENRPKDMKKLKEIKKSIKAHVNNLQMYNEDAENNKSKARKLTQEPQQLANSV
jgi:hypothetical protein